MDWGKIGQAVGSAAPILAGLLTNPVGTIASQAGKLLAKEFGVKETPSAVAKAIKEDPRAFIKVKEIESKERTELARINLEAKQAEIELETARVNTGSRDIGNVNATMQAEVTEIKHPWAGAWRPFWGFSSAIAFFICVAGLIVIVYNAVKAKDFTTLSHIPSLISSLAMLFGIPGAILGVASWHRGQKQRIEAGEVKTPTIVGALASRIQRG